MPTANLGLQTINGGDPLSPAVINDNFANLDNQLGVDYVVSKGISGGWMWRIWKSGLKEAWTRRDHISEIPPRGCVNVDFTLPFNAGTDAYFVNATQNWTNGNTQPRDYTWIQIIPFKMTPTSFTLNVWNDHEHDFVVTGVNIYVVAGAIPHL